MSEKKKSGCFGKILKLVLWGFVGLVALIALLLAAMPLWISPVATGVANGIVPKITGTPFRMERCYVNPWTGAVRINGVRLSNPEGFGQAPAVSVTSVSVDLALFELLSNKLHIKDLTIVDPFASYYSHDGANNIDVILSNVEKTLGKKEEAEKEKEEEKKEPSQMKIIIDHLKVSGTKVKLMENDVIPPLPIMTIELNDIGKESDGASFDEAWKSISDAFLKGMSSVGDGLGALGGLFGDGAKSAAGATAEATRKVASGAADLTKNAAGAVGDGAKAAAGAVGDGAKAAAGAVGDGAKAAAGAIGDGAKAATEGVKNLFKGFGK